MAATKTRPVASGGARRDQHDRDQRELMQPIPEQRDQLAGPQRRERPVEGEPDVRVLADPLDGFRGQPRNREPQRCRCGGGGVRGLRSRCPRAKSARRGGRQPLPGTAEHQRPVEGGAFGEPGRQSRLERALAVAVLGTGAGGQPGQAVPDGLELLLGQLLRDAHHAGEQEEGETRRRGSASPTDATFWMKGSGIGMTSANGPRWSRKEAFRPGGSSVWMEDDTSAGCKPAASRLGSQIGM